jgi:hypothetical protein
LVRIDQAFLLHLSLSSWKEKVLSPVWSERCFALNLAPCSSHLYTLLSPFSAAGEMLHAAQPLLEKNLHPTVIVRGYLAALDDAVKVRQRKVSYYYKVPVA